MRAQFAELLESRLLLSEWYVSPSGSDANAGTLASPFATIARGMQSAQPGDNVYLRAGTYRETLSAVRSGLPGQPITVTSYNGEAVYISASDTVDGPWAETSPGSGIYSSPVASSLPAQFWTNWGQQPSGAGVVEQGGNLIVVVVNSNTYATTMTRSVNASSVWDFFAQPVTWSVRDLSITSTGTTPLAANQAYAYFSFMSDNSSGWSADDSINVTFNGAGRLGLNLKKNTPNSWGTSVGALTNTAITGFDLTVGPGTAGNLAYTLIAQPMGQVVATGQWALTQGEWSDGGTGNTSYLQAFAQEGATTTDPTQRFDLRIGSCDVSAGGDTVLFDDFNDGDPNIANYFPSGRSIDLSAGYDQVFVNGEMQYEARHVNKTTADLMTPDAAAVTMNNTYGVTSSSFSGKPDNFFAGARFVGRVGQGWSWQTAVVTSSSGNLLQLDATTASSWWWPNQDNRTSDSGIGYVYGKLEFLNADGEWYLQKSATGPDTLYLRIAAGTSPAGQLVEHKVRNWTVNIGGYDNIVIDGLNLRGGAVRLNGSGLVMQNCDARYLSHYQAWSNGSAVNGGLTHGGGIVVSGSGNVVRNSTIHDTAGSGIVAGGSNHLLTRNHIYNTDYSGTYGCGIDLTGSGHIVTFNSVHDAGRDILRPGGAGLTVMYNDLYRAGRMALDLGLIYTWGANGLDSAGRKTRIAYNYVHDRGNPADSYSTGIYLDNYDRSFIVDHNVIWGFSGSTYSPAAMRLNSPVLGVEIYNNTIINSPSYNVSTYSCYPTGNPDPFWTTTNHGLDYIAQNNLIVPTGTDPTTVFQDYANRDFRLKPGNAAIDPATTTGLTEWLSPNGTTNVPSNFRLWLQTPNQQFHYREVTGQGVSVPGINDGFLGATPDSGAYEAGGTYWMPGVNGFADQVAPFIQSWSVNDDAAQRSLVKNLTVVFSEPVVLGPLAIDVRRAGGAAIPGLVISPTSAHRQIWSVYFSGTPIVGGSLPDGIFNLVVYSASVQDFAGNAMASDFIGRFHRLFGDSDGDRDVDNTDLAAFRLALNKPLAYVDYFDYDGNGTITNSDYAQFKQRLTRRLLR